MYISMYTIGGGVEGRFQVEVTIPRRRSGIQSHLQLTSDEPTLQSVRADLVARTVSWSFLDVG